MVEEHLDTRFTTGTSTVWYRTSQSGVSTSSNDVYGDRSLRLRCTGTSTGTLRYNQLRWLPLTAFAVYRTPYGTKPATSTWYRTLRLPLTALAVRTVRYTQLRWLQFSAFAVRTVPTVHPATLVTAKLVTAKLTAFVVRVTSVAGCTVRYTQLRWLQLTAFAVRVTSVAGCTVRYTQLRWRSILTRFRSSRGKNAKNMIRR